VALFLSTFMNKVDRKGRVSVPASFRSALAGQSFNGVVAFRSFKTTALECSGMDRMEDIARRLGALEEFSDEHDTLSTLFSDAQQMPFDTEGRIILPEAMIEFAGIKEIAAFVGVGPSFQIWEPQAHAAVRDAARQRARDKGLTMPRQFTPPGSPS